MEKIHLVRPSIGAILEECKPNEFDGNNLIIKTTGGSGFSVKMVERGIPMIEKILADEMDFPIKVNFVNGGGDSQSKSKPNKKNRKYIPMIINYLIKLSKYSMVKSYVRSKNV